MIECRVRQACSENIRHKIAVITGGVNVPSRRFRVCALVPYLARYGIRWEEICPTISTYPPRNRALRPFWFAAALTERLTYLVQARGFDATVIQRELISTVPTIERFIPGPRIFDVDDAIFLRKRGVAAKNAATTAVGVVCGNRYLAEYFSRWNKNIAVIPTGVDTAQLKPRATKEKVNEKIVGWIGTSANMVYLEPVAAGIRRAVERVSGSKLCVVSDSADRIPKPLRPIAHFVQWRPYIENECLPYWSVGLMPLTPGPWERGKCAFKLLQYLGAGVPAVASPVGMNVEVMNGARVGHLVDDEDSWEDAIVDILTNESVADEMAINARKLVEERYSLEVVAALWSEVLDQWLGAK